LTNGAFLGRNNPAVNTMLRGPAILGADVIFRKAAARVKICSGLSAFSLIRRKVWRSRVACQGGRKLRRKPPRRRTPACRWLLMMHDRAEGEALPYTHEFLAHMLGANRKSVTLAAQSLQTAGLISYHRGTIQVVDRSRLEKASCECYAIVKERFDAFLTPPKTAVHGDTRGRRKN
jgi:Crp-like helix-turn-helix domain